MDTGSLWAELLMEPRRKAKRLVLDSEGVEKMLRTKLAHKNQAKIPKTVFLILLYMQ